MIDSIINCKDLKKADTIVLSAGYGQSFTYRGGAEKGPAEVIKCLHGNLEFFDRFLLFEPVHLMRTSHYELKGLNKLSPQKMVQKIESFYYENKGKFILMLGGDHSVSIGAFSYFEKYQNSRDITILQVDAHPDLRDNTLDYKETSNPINHACVMRRAYEMGFKTVQIGIRTYSIYDHKFIKSKKLKVFEWGRGKNPSVRSVINSIKTKKVYLTLDIDGLDPSYAPGTGTPVPGGLSWEYISELIRELIINKEIVGADIVEVAPLKEDILTQYLAAHLCYNIISYKIMKDKKILKFF